MDNDDLFADMAAQLADVEIPTETDYASWSMPELIDELSRLDEVLMARSELLAPTTQEGRELHSQRGAIVVIMHRLKGTR